MMAQRLAQAAASLAVSICLAGCESPAPEESTRATDSFASEAALSTSCTDQAPPTSPFTCAEQARWNKCNESWMAGYCAQSCRRCNDPASQLECPGPLASAPELAHTPHPRRPQSWMSTEQWCQRARMLFNLPDRDKAELVLIGDSITEGFPKLAGDLLQERFGSYHPVAIAIGGDQTQNVLWHIDHGVLDGLPRAKVVMLLLGVNNLTWGGFSPEETAAGVEAVRAAILARLPRVHILQLGIFPAYGPDHEVRGKVLRTNALLAKLPESSRVSYFDLGERFLQSDGTLRDGVMYDGLHPSYKGYEIWAQAVEPRLKAALTRP